MAFFLAPFATQESRESVRQNANFHALYFAICHGREAGKAAVHNLAGVAQSQGYRVALAQSKLIPLKRAEDVLTMANGPSERSPSEARLDEPSRRAPAEARREEGAQRPPGAAMAQDRQARQERGPTPSQSLNERTTDFCRARGGSQTAPLTPWTGCSGKTGTERSHAASHSAPLPQDCRGP